MLGELRVSLNTFACRSGLGKGGSESCVKKTSITVWLRKNKRRHEKKNLILETKMSRLGTDNHQLGRKLFPSPPRTCTCLRHACRPATQAAWVLLLRSARLQPGPGPDAFARSPSLTLDGKPGPPAASRPARGNLEYVVGSDCIYRWKMVEEGPPCRGLCRHRTRCRYPAASRALMLSQVGPGGSRALLPTTPDRAVASESCCSACGAEFAARVTTTLRARLPVECDGTDPPWVTFWRAREPSPETLLCWTDNQALTQRVFQHRSRMKSSSARRSACCSSAGCACHCPWLLRTAADSNCNDHLGDLPDGTNCSRRTLWPPLVEGTRTAATARRALLLSPLCG